MWALFAEGRDEARAIPIPRSMRRRQDTPHTYPRRACRDGPGPIARDAGRWSSSSQRRQWRCKEGRRGGATKPPTPRLAAVEAAEQAPARHEAADAAAGRGGGGGASPRT
jgi:hypothetical protein